MLHQYPQEDSVKTVLKTNKHKFLETPVQVRRPSLQRAASRLTEQRRREGHRKAEASSLEKRSRQRSVLSGSPPSSRNSEDANQSNPSWPAEAPCRQTGAVKEPCRGTWGWGRSWAPQGQGPCPGEASGTAARRAINSGSLSVRKIQRMHSYT